MKKKLSLKHESGMCWEIRKKEFEEKVLHNPCKK